MSPLPDGTEVDGDIPYAGQFFDKGGAVYNVMHPDFGATGDGSTDDTASIQAAIDAAGLVRGIVFFPTPHSGSYMFSNLKIPQRVTLQGSGMHTAALSRIVGSTGTAVREKNTSEGNASGATGIWIRDMRIEGNSTAGDGINLGNEEAVGFNFLAGLNNITVRGFSSGTAISLNIDATICKFIWGNTSQKGLVVTGAAGQFHGVWAEGNTVNEVEILGTGHRFFGIYCETSNVIVPISLGGTGRHVLFGPYLSIKAALTHGIQIQTGSRFNAIYSQFSSLGSGGSLTNNINDIDAAWTSGFGATVIPFYFNDSGSAPGYMHDEDVTNPIEFSSRGITASSTFSASDTTPSVIGGKNFLTHASTQTLTDFDGGVTGQRITVVSKAAVTFAFSGDLTGSSASLVTASGDITEWYCEDGTVWILTGYVDVSVDNSAGA